MSFSFSVTAPTLVALALAAATKMSEVVEQQPVHARDEATVNATITQQIGLLAESEAFTFAASVSGSIGLSDDEVTYANVSVAVSRSPA